MPCTALLPVAALLLAHSRSAAMLAFFALTDCDVAIGALQHLVHSLRPQGRSQGPGYRLGCLDAALHCLYPLNPGLVALLLRARMQGIPSSCAPLPCGRGAAQGRAPLALATPGGPRCRSVATALAMLY